MDDKLFYRVPRFPYLSQPAGSAGQIPLVRTSGCEFFES